MGEPVLSWNHSPWRGAKYCHDIGLLIVRVVLTGTVTVTVPVKNTTRVKTWIQTLSNDLRNIQTDYSPASILLSIDNTFLASTGRWTNAGIMLGQRHRWYTNILPSLVQRLVLAGKLNLNLLYSYLDMIYFVYPWSVINGLGPIIEPRTSLPFIGQ